MADQSDVETALVGRIQGLLYPQGSDGASAVGAACKIYRGWPLSAALNADLQGGRVNLSIVPVAGSLRPVTCFSDGWIGGDNAQAAMSATVSGDAVTFAGSPDAGQLAGLLVDGVPYVYAAAHGDTLAGVAAALAAKVSADRTATSEGALVRVPSVIALFGRTAAQVALWMEIRRQRQDFSIMIWCPTPKLRDSVAAFVDAGLAQISFLSLADGSDGRLIFTDSTSQDQNQNATLYRRDLIYRVEYATTISATTAQMLFGGLSLNGSNRFS